MRKTGMYLLPEVLLDYASERTASTSDNAYKHLENILNITRYISNSKLVNVEVQNLDEEDSIIKTNQLATRKISSTSLESLLYTGSRYIPKSSHEKVLSEQTEDSESIKFDSQNEVLRDSQNEKTTNINMKSNIILNKSNLHEMIEGYSPSSTVLNAAISQSDGWSENKFWSEKRIPNMTLNTKEHRNEIEDETIKPNIINNISNVSYIKPYVNLSPILQSKSFAGTSSNLSLTENKLYFNNNQRGTFIKDETNMESIRESTSLSQGLPTAPIVLSQDLPTAPIVLSQSLPTAPMVTAYTKEIEFSKTHIPTVKSDVNVDSFEHDSFGNEEKPILTQNNVSFYFNDISTSVVLSVGISLAFALLLFFLTALWIIKRKKYHSKVYFSYELAKPQSRHISKHMRPMRPCILPGEVVIDNQSVSELESPREPMFLQDEKSSNLTLNKRLSDSAENCDHGIDNPAYIGATAYEEQSLGKQDQPELKLIKKENARTRRSAPKYTKKRKMGVDFPPRVCSSDGSIFPASPSLTRCLVPPPPYSPSIRNEKHIFTLPAGNKSNSSNVNCESSY